MNDLFTKYPHTDTKNSQQCNIIDVYFREIRDDIEQEDVQEAFFRYMEENPNAGVIQDEDDDVEYDEDGNPILKHKVTQENK